MSDPKNVQEKMSSLGARIASNANEAMREARPAVDRVTHRVKDELSHLRESGEEAVSDVQHKIEKEARKVRVNAEHLIQHQPFNSILIAAGTGAVAALAVSWFMHSRTD